MLEHMHATLADPALQGERRAQLQKAAGYFQHNLSRMYYAGYRKRGRPIGSGVTEAACKTLVKQRLCGSGMKWKHRGAATVLRLRALVLTDGRWEQFWSHLSRFGC